MNWSELPLSSKSELMKLYLKNGITSLSAMKEHYNSFAEGGLMNDDEPPKPKFKQSQEQYYDRNNDIIYAQDSIGEGYQHEYFHARPNTTLLNNLRPYYENLNDNKLIELGADLPFVKRLENDPNHFYSPEEIGARVSAARYMLNKAGINTIDIDFLRNARKNELQYGDNFRDLLHMYNDENLLQILNTQYSKGGHLYQTGGPDGDKYKFLIREPQVAVADNTRVVLSPNPIEIAQARAEYEAQQLQAEMVRAAQNQPQLRADTRTDSDRKREAQRSEKQVKLDATRAAQRDFMSLGRPNTESQQTAVMAMPYVAGAASNYLRNGNIARDLGYFVPGISNVLMAQDARTAFDNNQTGTGVVNAAFALAPMLGVTPNFNSPLRYTRPANRVGDWTILDYGRNTTTTPVQSSATPMLNMPNSLRLNSVERPSLSTRPTQGRIGTTNRLQLPETTESFRALEETAYQEHLEDLYNNAGGLNADELFEELEALRAQEPVNIQTQAPHAHGITEAQAQELRDLAGVPLDPGFEFGLEDAPLLGHNPFGPNPEPEKLGGNLIPSTLNIRPQIKPLIKGAEIEKQLSKAGTISRKSLDAYIAKQGKYYQDIMQEVLESDFKGVDKINYASFQDAVQKRLPEYKRISQKRFEDYGFNRIDDTEYHPDYLSQQDILKYGTQEELDDLRAIDEDFDNGNIDSNTRIAKRKVIRTNIVNRIKPSLSTFTFESSGIKGDTRHYGGNPIGHSRTYITKKEPDVLHVMESQSDWAQHISKKKVTEEGMQNFYDAHPELQPIYDIDMFIDNILEIRKEFPDIDQYFKSRLDELPNQEKHMVENYTLRQIQENLRYAAEQGQTKMRYPTRETAAKIEMYSGTPYGEYYDVKKELDEVNGTLYGMTHLPEPPMDVTGRNTGKELSEATRVRQRIAEIMESDMYKQTAKKAAELRKKLREVQDKKYIKYSPEHETILKKYDAFPKQYQKLFGKKAEVRTVTDSKGNTWYEVDVPESYRNGTGQIIFSLGGLLGAGALTDK